jgi:hypothetical protein
MNNTYVPGSFLNAARCQSRLRGVSRVDVLAGVGACAALACFAAMLNAGPARQFSFDTYGLSNLRTIGVGINMYRNDNQGRMPIYPLYYSQPRFPYMAIVPSQISGYNTWMFGGKNTSAYWTTYQSGLFDIEAADRPLNSYVMPE